MNEQTKENIGTALFVVALAGIIIFILTAGASALSITEISISPNTSIMANQPITAEFSVEFTPTSQYTIDPEASFRVSTDLQDPQWTWQLTADSVKGQDISAQGNPLVLNGWQFAYPLGTREKVHITLSGRSPNVTRSQQENVFSAAEYDRNGVVQPGSVTTIGLLVIDPTDISYIRSQEKARLDQLKRDIKSANTTGIRGQTPIEQLYQQAETGILYLDTLQPSEYDRAVSRSQEIDRDLQDAEDLLSRDAVQSQIDKATIPLNQTAQVLQWFTAQNQTGYPGYANISERYDNARADFDTAISALQKKDWAIAGSKAASAYEQANTTTYDALSLQKRAMDPLIPLWENIWLVILAVVGAGLYLLFGRKKKHVENRNNKM